MKFRIALLLLCMVLPIFARPVSPFSLPVGTVVLDAGHGGHDPGATAVHQYESEVLIEEKHIVLDIMLRVAESLRQWEPGIAVVTTRSDDRYLPLEERSEIAASTDPGVGKSSLFISIHANSAPVEEANGFELLVKPTDVRVHFLNSTTPDWALVRYANHTMAELNRLLNRQTLLLASTMEQSLATRFPQSRDRGIKEQDVWILNMSRIPSVLVEIGFISNPEEASLMITDAWRSEMAEAIVDGIGNYLNRD